MLGVLQTWQQSKPSTITFGIAPHRSWNAETGEFREGIKRWADLYVFCVFRGISSEECLNLSKWDFYVIATRILDRKIPNQNTIRLSSLERLSPCKCSFGELKMVIMEVQKEIKGRTDSSS